MKASKFIKLMFHISWIKTLSFNLYHLKFRDASYLPFLISKSTSVFPIKGSIIIQGKVKPGMIKIGIDSLPMFKKRLGYKSLFRLTHNSNVIFRGKANFNNGVRITSGGHLDFGNDFAITGPCLIVCDNEIQFGDNTLISWECQIMDNDFHNIIINQNQKSSLGNISIGNNVWIGSRVIVNKGCWIPDNCVIASGSLVNKKFDKSNLLIGGVPAKIIKDNIEWVK